MLGTPTIADLIRRDELGELKSVMEKSTESGMQTFDIALYRLVVAGAISDMTALEYADSNNNLRLKLKLHTESVGANKQPPEAWDLL
jgi:twitching motility protein PilU